MKLLSLWESDPSKPSKVSGSLAFAFFVGAGVSRLQSTSVMSWIAVAKLEASSCLIDPLGLMEGVQEGMVDSKMSGSLQYC